MKKFFNYMIKLAFIISLGENAPEKKQDRWKACKPSLWVIQYRGSGCLFLFKRKVFMRLVKKRVCFLELTVGKVERRLLQADRKQQRYPNPYCI